MPETETAAAPEKETKDNTTRKRVRHRKKLLYEKILHQIEFYFSDANLSKDRYLGQLLKDDPYVPLEVFLKFNKIRSLTNDIYDIAKAMKHSTLLDISEDRTKVKRKVPMMPYDADERTVYVESIPATANIDWLQKVFGEYGKVAYISLPKFKETKKIKGYAFIEYDTAEGAVKCLKALTELGCKLPTTTPLDEIASIKTFTQEHSENISQTNTKEKKDENDEPPKKKIKKKDKKQPKSLDLKLSDSFHSQSKADTPDDESVATPTEETKNISSDTLPEGDTPESAAAKKKKRRKNNEKSTDDRFAVMGVQVLSKREWKSLRNRYLNLQREQIKAARRAQRHTQPDFTEMGSGAAAGAEPNESALVRLKIKDYQDVRTAKRQALSEPRTLHVSLGEGERHLLLRFDCADAARQYVSRKEDAELVDETVAAGLPTPSATHLRFDD